MSAAHRREENDVMRRRNAGAVIALVIGSLVMTGAAQAPQQHAQGDQPLFLGYDDVKWDRIIPDMGDSSPEIAILRVDPKTQATQLLIRTPKGIHVRKHWHTANETHTMILGTATFECDGKRFDIGPGGFNYMPARMIHEAWLPAGSLTFITVDAAWDVNWVDGAPTAVDLIK